jgi:hypothetical protein
VIGYRHGVRGELLTGFKGLHQTERNLMLFKVALLEDTSAATPFGSPLGSRPLHPPTPRRSHLEWRLHVEFEENSYLMRLRHW